MKRNKLLNTGTVALILLAGLIGLTEIALAKDAKSIINQKVEVSTVLANTTPQNSAASTKSGRILQPAAVSKRALLQSTPSLTVTKSANTNMVEPGQTLTYTVVISNGSQVDNATGVVISDTISTGSTFVTGSVAITPSSAGGVSGSPPLIASGITVTAHSLVTVTYAVTVNSPLDHGTIITNTVALTSTEISTPATHTITTTVSNVAPVAIHDTFATNEDVALSQSLTASDPNGGSLTYGILTPPMSGTVAITNSSTGNFIYTPTTNVNGIDSFTYVVTDSGNLTDTATVTVTVTPVNDPPVLAAIGNKAVDEESLLTFTPSVTDVDSPPGSFSFGLAPGAPAGAAIGASSGIFTWTPTEAQGAGIYTVTIVVSDTGTPVLTDSETIAITVIEIAELAISKSALPDSVVAGTNTLLTYILFVANSGPSVATGVVLTDALSTDVTFVSASFGGGSCSEVSGTVTCSRVSLNKSETALAIIIVTVNAATTGTLVNTATVGSAIIDRNSANNIASTTTSISTQADLSIAKSDSPDPVLVSDPLTYTLTVTNAGPSVATGIIITNTLSANVSFRSASSGCNNSGLTVTCTIGSLGPGLSKAVTIVVTPTAAGSVDNSAQVSSPATDLFPANNSITESTTVNPKANLVISITDTPDPIVTDNYLTYTVIITNLGPSTATGVIMTDSLPTAMNYVSATLTAGSCSGTTLLTCNLNDISSGSSVTVTIIVTAVAATPITAANIVSVQTNDLDPNLDNNTATETTAITVPTPRFKLVYLPVILGADLVKLSIRNNNTGGSLTFVVRDLATKVGIISCVVPNNTILFCGTFPPGTYEVQAFTACGGAVPNPIAVKSYYGGPVTTQIFCN